MFGLLCHVIVVNMEHHMLSQVSLSRRVWSCESTLLSIAHYLQSAESYPT